MYLALARDFILAGNFSRIDPYLYSLKNAHLVWTHEYLSYLVYHAAWWLLGIPGLILLKSLILSLGFAVTLRARPVENNRSWLWIALWIAAVIAASFRFVERSSLFSDLFTLILIAWLIDAKTLTRGLLIRLTILFLLWVQLHPGFPIGLILLGTWTLWHWLKEHTLSWKQVLALFIPVAVLILNPEGWVGAVYPFEFSLNEAQVLKRYNFEWFPAYHRAFATTPEVLAFWFLSAASLFCFLKSRAWFTLRFIFSLLLFVIAAGAVRFVPVAAFSLLILVKPYAELKSLSRAQRPAILWALSVLLILIAGKNLLFGYESSSGHRLAGLSLDPKFFPDKTLSFLETHPIPGRLYNVHEFGTYLIWKKHIPVFHHGFVTDMKFYDQDVIGVFRSYERFNELAQKYGWTMLLVDRYNGYRRFYQLLAPHPEWRIVEEDDASFLIYRFDQ
jgi:hypothetical protein